jgi:transcriptional regulator with XRE-family HTH domain
MSARIRTSKALFIAVKCHRLKQRELAQRAGLDPGTLSKLIHNDLALKPNDLRVRRLARVVSLPIDEAFESAAAPLAAVREEENRA